MATTTFHDGFVSELIGRPVMVDRDGARTTVGKVADFVVEHPEDTFPRIDAIIVKTRYGELAAPIAEVASIDTAGVVLTAPPKIVRPPDDEALYLVEDLFDKQIVDVDGRKVVRINDIEVARTGGALRVVAADIGVGGLLVRAVGVGGDGFGHGQCPVDEGVGQGVVRDGVPVGAGWRPEQVGQRDAVVDAAVDGGDHGRPVRVDQQALRGLVAESGGERR